MNKMSLKSAIRNAKKNSVLTFAKLFGISISFAVILFSAGYVFFETSYDKFLPDYDRTYLCLMEGKLNNSDVDFAVTSPIMGPIIVNEIPEIEEATRMTTRGDANLFFEDKVIEMGQLLFADSNFFSFFNLPVQKVTNSPFETENNIAIAKSIAINHFGSVEQALNKVVGLRGDDCTITAVFDDFPKNFHLQYKLIQSIDKSNPHEIGWDSQSYYTYIKTKSNEINIDDLNFKLTKCVYTHDTNNEIDGANATCWADLTPNNENYIHYSVEPIKKVHFSNHKFNIAQTSNKIYVFGAIILSLLVLLISSVNYVNLTIANITTRYKEIGIRKTNGAGNNQVAFQFLNESVIFWIIGFILAVGIYYLGALPLANYLQLTIELSTAEFIKILVFLFVSLVAFNLLTNTFPIFFISNKKILNLVKEDTSGKKHFSVKSSFVLFQFALSAFIILSSVIVQKQVNYMVSNDRGYNGENVIMLSLWALDENKREAFVNELSSNAAITDVSTSYSYFGSDPSMNGAFFESYSDENFFHTSTLAVDAAFANTFDMQMLAGRFFENNKTTDFESAIINKAALKEYDGTESIIGKRLIYNGNYYNIIGVIDNFNYRSLHHKVLPLIFVLAENCPITFIKTNQNQVVNVLTFLEKQWEEFNVPGVFDYELHDAVVAQAYQKDQQAKKLMMLLSVISIVIACVGLYAISFFTIIKRTKEIGIRKVNGAKNTEVVALLTKDFATWVIAAFILASPVAYFVMIKWLENFAFKTALSWWIFALAGLVALGIALLTISWQSWKAARRNPVEALRYE